MDKLEETAPEFKLPDLRGKFIDASGIMRPNPLLAQNRIKELNDAFEKYDIPRGSGLHATWKVEEFAGKAALYEENIITGSKVCLTYLPLDIDPMLLRDMACISAFYFREGKETGKTQIKTGFRELMGI